MNTKFFISFCFLLALNTFADAQVKYISDVTYVPLRSGQGADYRILHYGLRTGLKLEVIRAPQGSEWTEVKTPSGLQGWIKNQYLRSTPTAQQQLKQAQVALTRTQETFKTLKAEKVELESEHNALKNLAKNAQNQSQSLAEQYKELKTLSQDAVNLSQRYKSLLAKHELTQTQLDAVSAENDQLRRSETVNKYITGGGLVLLGVLLTLILPSLKPKKQNSDWV